MSMNEKKRKNYCIELKILHCTAIIITAA